MSGITQTQHLPPGLTGTSYQPIQIVNNINTEKKDEKKDEKGGYLPGRSLYYLAEGYFHYTLFNLADATGVKHYQAIYLTGLVAGAAFGLYKAMTTEKKETPGFEQRAVAFGKGGLLNKAISFAELYGTGPLLMGMAESYRPIANMSLANVVAGHWGFSLGYDMSTLVYNSNHKPTEKAAQAGDKS